MAVAFDAKSTSDITANSATSFSDSTKMTVGSSANAMLLLMSWQGSSAPTGVSLSWNGSSFTLISGTTAANSTGACNVALYGLLNPTPGTHTLGGSWTGAADFCACAISFSGVNTNSLAAAFPNGNTATGNSQTPSVTVTSATTDMTVAAFIDDGTHGFNSVANTQIFLDNTPNHICAAGSYAAGAASVTMSAAIGVASVNWAVGAVDVAAAADVLMAQIWL